jgi:hypothetical protein
VLSKFVIVAVLSLAVGALGASDGSMASELAGGALLALAAFAPFTLLRLVPFVESSAAHQLEGVRHRFQRATVVGGRSAASFVLDRAAGASLPELVAGTGTNVAPEAPGPDNEATPGGSPIRADVADALAVPMWRGSPATERPLVLAGRSTTAGPSDSSPPLWGGPVPPAARRSAPQGVHVIERDELGPVLRWRPDLRPPVADPDER